MASIAVLHWLTARSFFFVQLMPYDILGNPVPAAKVDACAFSGTAVFYAFILTGVLILALIGFSLRRLPAGMPMGGTCSLVISAASHFAEGDENAAFRPVMYGVFGHDFDGGEDRERIGFSSRSVGPLEKDKAYTVEYFPR